jgi:hypothetical protein
MGGRLREPLVVGEVLLKEDHVVPVHESADSGNALRRFISGYPRRKPMRVVGEDRQLHRGRIGVGG